MAPDPPRYRLGHHKVSLSIQKHLLTPLYIRSSEKHIQGS